MDNRININSTQHSQELKSTSPRTHDRRATEENAKLFSNQVAKKKNKKPTENHNQMARHGKKSVEDSITALSSQIAKNKKGDNDKNSSDILKNLEEKNHKKDDSIADTIHSNKNISDEKHSGIQHNFSISNTSSLSANNSTAINNTHTDLNALLEKLADKIHTTAISSKSNLSSSEVRISLKNDILPNTEIQIQRTKSELIISFNTNAEQSKALLINNENSLQKILSEKFSGDKVQVNINLSQEQNQGRSRNQYFSEEQLDDENKE
jgi:type III secretion system needle length determinant